MLISIGIPFYNCEDFLADAIKSILAQSYKDWELILIDDGSTDRSLEIACSFQDSRIRVISDGQNKKLPFRLNQIIEAAKGDYIARMDADDMVDPYRLEKQIEILLKHKDVDLVSTGVASISNDNQIRGIRTYNNCILSKYDIVSGNIGIVHASILARKSWYLRNKYREGIIAEDYELWNRAFFNSDLKCYKLAEPLYYYREDGNVTSVKLLRAYRNQISIISEYKKYISNFDYLRINIKMYFKVLVVYILNFTGMLDILLTRRSNQTMDEQIAADIDRKIKHILDDF